MEMSKWLIHARFFREDGSVTVFRYLVESDSLPKALKEFPEKFRNKTGRDFDGVIIALEPGDGIVPLF